MQTNTPDVYRALYYYPFAVDARIPEPDDVKFLF